MIKLSNEMKTVDAGSYYRDQLNSVKIDPTFGARIKITSITDTKWFTLNKESIRELRQWLNLNETKLRKPHETITMQTGTKILTKEN